MVAVPFRAESSTIIRWLPPAALAIVLALAAAWWVLYERLPNDAMAVLAGLAAVLYAGKEAGLPTGIALGADPLVMGLFVFFSDVAFAFFVYPFVAYAFDRWGESNGFVGRRLRAWRARAAQNESVLLKYGAMGLFLFMLIPFAFNGPLIGAILGRLAGLTARQIVPILVLAIGVTTAAWTTIYAFGLGAAASIHPDLPVIIAGTTLSLVAATILLSFLWSRFRSSPPKDPPVVDGAAPPAEAARASSEPDPRSTP